ncbi:MAG TPA: peptidyl-prolyl cis-trans isomerase [Methylomirabilota bacterium]|nr:peptidyl-prolyl cis-trans isomerase [Methylomirabilota bacterium]
MRVLCALVLGLLFVQYAVAQKVLSDGVAVIVNDSIITYYDVRRQIQDDIDLIERQYARQPEVMRQKKSDLHALGTEMLVDRQLILHEYKTAGYKYPESIIEDSIDDRIKQKFRDRATLLKGLHEQGITAEMWKQQQREEILIVAMQQLKAPRDVLVSPQKILDYYETNKTNFAMGEQVKLRMIALNKPAGDTGGVKDLAEEILRKINEGASFAEMAKIHSDGPQRNTGGDWGWADREHGTLRKELADVAFKLNPGEKSGVIDLPDACWIMLVEEKRPAHVRPLAEVRDDIERTLRIMEATRVQRKWLKRLRDKAFVSYF